MKKSILFLALAATAALFMSCGTTKAAAFPDMYSETPQVFLVMPPINNSSNAAAKDYFYTTMSVPLAEAGYYVLPPAAVYDTLQRESAYDSELFIEGDLSKFRKLLGADVAVFTVIKSWNKSFIGTRITIEVEYIFRSTKTNQTVFHRNAEIECDTSSNARVSGGGMLGTLINMTADAVKTAVTEYVDVAVMCNSAALSDLPAGKYSSRFGMDGAESAMGESIYRKAHKN